MNKIVILILLLTVTIITFGTAYFIPFFSTRPIRKGKFDLFQFMNLFFAPVLIVPILYFFREIMMRNPFVPVLYFPKYVVEITFLILVYFLVLGNGIHSVAVVLSKHMKDLQKHKIWDINEYFHQGFSHILITASAVLIMFQFSIFEINRPALLPLTAMEIAILIISGIVAGIVLGLASVEGGIPKPMFVIIYVLSLAIPAIFIWYGLSFQFYPYTTFLEVTYAVSIITLSTYRYKRKGFPEIVPQYFFEEK